MSIHTCVPEYTSAIFHPPSFRTVCRWVVAEARRTKIEAIAGSGHSGLPVAAVVAHELNIPLLAVRQRRTDAHDDRRVNGILPRDGNGADVRYGIVDDFIASGETVERIVMAIAAEWPKAVPFYLFMWSPNHGHDLTDRILRVAPEITLVRRRDETLPF